MLCVVEVISHCYMVDMVTCCLIIRYSHIKLESCFPPICYLILISSVCNVIYLFTVFIYLFIIISYQLGLPHSSTLLRCSMYNSVLSSGLCFQRKFLCAYFWYGTSFFSQVPFALNFRMLYLFLIFLKWSQPQNEWAVSSSGGCMTFGLYNNVVWGAESVSCQMIWENCHIC